MLSDLLVLELASVLAGPSVGQFFAEWGATVLKIENPRTGGDVTRRWTLPTEPAEAERGAYFACCNHGKQSVALDLGTAGGRAVLHRLAARADVALTSFRPGTAVALGADAATLRAQNPALVVGALTGYGPDDARAGYDAVIQAESGFMYLNGPADGPPTKLPVALMDVLAAHQLKEALLVALLQRAATGAGAVVRVGLLQAAVSALANQATNWLVAGDAPQRTGSRHPQIAPYGPAYRTRDGRHVVLAVGTDRQFAALCDALGMPEQADDPRFATNADRLAHRDALAQILADRLAQHDAGALLADLAARHVPAGPVRDLPRVFADPLAQRLLLTPHADDPDAKNPDAENPDADARPPRGLRQVAATGLPHAGPDAPADALAPPPRYAAHTADALRTHLGLDDDTLATLAADGAIVL